MKHWISDSEAPECMKCNNQFTCCFRRHHCRGCGFVVCGACSGHQIRGERACRSCFEKDQQAQTRQSTLTSSPLLRHVEKLSPLVQFDGKSGHKASSRARTDSKITASPRINHSMKHLEAMFGSPHGAPTEAKTDISSPILSRTISRTRVLSGPKVVTAPSTKLSSRADKKAFVPAPNDAMIVVDPFSTGAVVVAEFISRGCRVIRVLSDEFPDHILNLVLEGTKLEYIATIPHKGNLNTTVSELVNLKKEWNFLGCIPGCETGVELADAIAEALNLRTNGTALSDNRRNKFLMNEQIRKKGCKAVIQARASTLIEVNAFIKRFGTGPMKVVIKPVSSAGSDHVYICRSGDELRKRFDEIVGGTNLLGKKNVEVVMQEFLEGKEYVVDTVSLNGVHKLMGIWEYDKRNVNGHDFVYFGCRLKSGDGKVERELFNYQKGVLDALEIKHGAGHGEVMYTPSGPRLVEVGARCHGAEGNWVPLANKCYGTSQVKALVDTYLDVDTWNASPEVVTLTDWFAVKVDLVSRVEGKLKALPRLDDLKALPSFMKYELMVKIGDQIKKTIDCITTPGSVLLVSQDKLALETDFLRIREMEEQDFFVV